MGAPYDPREDREYYLERARTEFRTALDCEPGVASEIHRQLARAYFNFATAPERYSRS